MAFFSSTSVASWLLIAWMASNFARFRCTCFKMASAVTPLASFILRLPISVA